jgi:hypothetical protein
MPIATTRGPGVVGLAAQTVVIEAERRVPAGETSNSERDPDSPVKGNGTVMVADRTRCDTHPDSAHGCVTVDSREGATNQNRRARSTSSISPVCGRVSLSP